MIQQLKFPSPPWQSSHHLPGKHLLNLQKVSTPYFINKFRYLKSRYENLCKLYGYGVYKGKPQTPQKQPYKVQYLHFLLPETIGLDPFYPFVHILNSTVFLLLDLSGKKQQKQNWPFLLCQTKRLFELMNQQGILFCLVNNIRLKSKKKGSVGWISRMILSFLFAVVFLSRSGCGWLNVAFSL